MFKFKKITVPANETEQLVVIETWMVSWTKRMGQFSGDTTKCYQAFTNEDDANRFKKALDDAHKLIGNTSGTYVSIERQTAGL